MTGYTLPEAKYTSDEFMEIYKKRSDKLYNDYKKLSVEETRERFSQLFDDCPIELHINPFGLTGKLEKHFSDWHILGNYGTKWKFIIPINKK